MTTPNKPQPDLQYERGGELRLDGSCACTSKTDSANTPPASSARARSWREPMQIDDVELRTDSANESPHSTTDFERRFSNEAHEARARRLAMQTTPLGQKPDAEAMYEARKRVAKELDRNREGVAAIRGIGGAIENYVGKKGGQP